MVKQTIRRLLGVPKALRAKQSLVSLADGDYITKNVPYECQFASPELTKDILEQTIDAQSDSNWRIFGFETVEDTACWVPRLCGVCCVKMAVDHHGAATTVAGLTNEGVNLGGYDIDRDIGWFYAPLLQLAETHGLDGAVQPHLSIYEVAKLVSSDEFVIASVNPEIIRGDKPVRSQKKSGHLVLVIGVRISNHTIVGFYIHNPSGKTPDMQRNAFIPLNIFVQAYGERGIVLWKSDE